VLSTHIDKGHIHNHIMFCAANFIDHKKYNSNKRSLYGIQNTSDRLCKEYGLSTIIPGKDKGRGLIEYTDASGQRVTRPAKGHTTGTGELSADRQGASWKSRLKKAIDGYIAVSSDFEDMLKRMEADGFTVKRAKYHSYKLPGADEKTRFTGGPSLGPEYSDDRIRERIAGRQKAPRRTSTLMQRPDDGRINLLIDIENNIKARQSAGYERALTIINLKEAARTLNYLTENNILEYAQLQGKITEAASLHRQTLDTLKAVEKRIADMGLLIKNIEVYRQTKPFYDRYRQVKNKDKYRREHEAEIILHEAALNTLKAIQAERGGQLPQPDTLRAEYAQLTREKDRLYQEYGKLKRQVKQLDTLKANVDKILNLSGREQEQDKRPTPVL
jgi:hypothetical protein